MHLSLWRPNLARVAVALAVVGFALAVAPPRAVAAGFTGDDPGDAYVGTGGLILPGGVNPDTRYEVATCPECRWRLSSPCVGDVSATQDPAGSAFSDSPTCTSVSRGCLHDRHLLRTWFARPGGPWQDKGVVCIAEPVTVTDIGQRVRDRVTDHLPELTPSVEPAQGAVTQIPANFGSGQAPGALAEDVTLAGLPVQLQAQARWLWRFGDGSRAVTDDPGCSFPCMQITHAYRMAGSFVVRVEASWAGRFWVDGLGPFDVPGPIHQDTTLPVTVGEGRALLALP